MNRKISVTIIVICVFLTVIVIFSIIKSTVHIYSIEYDIEPTCDSSGGHYLKCSICGKTIQTSKTEPLGHKGEWIVLKEPTIATPGEMEERCTVCKKQLDLIKTPVEFSVIPSLYLTGSGISMTDTNSVPVSFTYSENYEDSDITSVNFTGRTFVRLMNREPINTTKHSYVINNFTAENGDKPDFGDFGKCDEIYLYSNKDDPTFARRLLTYEQWRNIVTEKYPEYLNFISVSENVNYSGYNMLLYIKSKKSDYSFAGIYTLSIPYEIFAKNKKQEIKYAVEYTLGEEEYFKYIYGDTGDEEKVLESLKNKLAAGTSEIESFTNKEFLIDYCAFSLLVGNADAFTNIYWVTSDGNTWYPVFANTEHTFGRTSGSDYLSDPGFQIKRGSFWDSILSEYSENISRRIYDFASGNLTPEKMRSEFEKYVSRFDDEVYAENYRTYGKTYIDPNEEIENSILWYEQRVQLFAGELVY